MSSGGPNDWDDDDHEEEEDTQADKHVGQRREMINKLFAGKLQPASPENPPGPVAVAPTETDSSESATKESVPASKPPPPAPPSPMKGKLSPASPVNKGKDDLLAAIRAGKDLKKAPTSIAKPAAKPAPAQPGLFDALLVKLGTPAGSSDGAPINGPTIQRKIVGYTTHLSKEAFQENLESEFGVDAFSKGDFIPVYAGQEDQFKGPAQKLEIDVDLTKDTSGIMQFWPLEMQQGFSRESGLAPAPNVPAAAARLPIEPSLETVVPTQPLRAGEEVERQSLEESSQTDEFPSETESLPDDDESLPDAEALAGVEPLPDAEVLPDAETLADESLSPPEPQIPDILAAGAAQMPALSGDQVTLRSQPRVELELSLDDTDVPPPPPPRRKKDIDVEATKLASLQTKVVPPPPPPRRDEGEEVMDLFSALAPQPAAASSPDLSTKRSIPVRESDSPEDETVVEDFLTATPPTVRFEPPSRTTLSNFQLLTQSIKNKVNIDPNYYGVTSHQILAARQSSEMGLNATETFNLKMKMQPPAQPPNYDIHIQDNGQAGVDFYTTHKSEETLTNICKMAVENAVLGTDFSSIQDRDVEQHLRKAIEKLHRDDPDKAVRLNLSINGEIVPPKPRPSRRPSLGAERER